MLGVKYQVHMKGIGWGAWVQNGTIAGTRDESRRIEAIRWELMGIPDGEEVFLHGNAHCENIGWMGFVPDGEICGTVGEGKRLEAMQFSLVGKDADKYSIQYRVTNAQDIGKMGWAKDSELAGTEGAGLRAEAIQLLITEKGVDLAGYEVAFKHFEPVVIPEPVQPTQGAYFGPDEFKCECGCGGDVTQELKDLANRVREIYGHPLVISSGFRCEYQNSKDGGIPGSNHMYGHAADMYSPGRMNYDEVDVIADCIRQAGGGVIRYHSNLFCHMELSDADWSMN